MPYSKFPLLKDCKAATETSECFATSGQRSSMMTPNAADMVLSTARHQRQFGNSNSNIFGSPRWYTHLSGGWKRRSVGSRGRRGLSPFFGLHRTSRFPLVCDWEDWRWVSGGADPLGAHPIGSPMSHQPECRAAAGV